MILLFFKFYYTWKSNFLFYIQLCIYLFCCIFVGPSRACMLVALATEWFSTWNTNKVSIHINTQTHTTHTSTHTYTHTHTQIRPNTPTLKLFQYNYSLFRLLHQENHLLNAFSCSFSLAYLVGILSILSYKLN